MRLLQLHGRESEERLRGRLAMPDDHEPGATRRVRILQIHRDDLSAFFRGQRRILNFPHDGVIAAIVMFKHVAGLRVHSETYPPVPRGELLDIVIAVTARTNL